MPSKRAGISWVSLTRNVANEWGATQTFSNDTLLALGTDEDTVLVNNSAGLSADEELANVIEGTSDHQGVAANSLILSNITNDGDIMMLVSDGGNSKEFLLANGDTADLQLGHAMATVTVKTASGNLSLSPGGDVVSTVDKMTIGANADSANTFAANSNRSGAGSALFQQNIEWNDTVVVRLQALSGADTSNKDEGRLRILTAIAGGTLTEAVRWSEATNTSLGGSAEHAATVGTKILSMFDGTAPVGTLASGGSFFANAATNVEINWIDSAGNAEQLSTT